jgi:hypothetical protein
LPKKVELAIVVTPELKIAPPFTAWLPSKVQLSTLSVAQSFTITPPPEVVLPLLTVRFCSVSSEKSQGPTTKTPVASPPLMRVLAAPAPTMVIRLGAEAE